MPGTTKEEAARNARRRIGRIIHTRTLVIDCDNNVVRYAVNGTQLQEIVPQKKNTPLT
ncbi:hypothetical protein LCGC14_2627790, partial [marine sediment metagenome]